MQAAVKTAANVDAGHMVAAFADALFDASDGFGGILNPKVMKFDLVAERFCFLEMADVGFSAECGFKSEVGSFLKEALEFGKEEPARVNGGGVGVER